MLIAVGQSNYGMAKDQSTEFFGELHQTAAVRDDRRREVLMAVLARRDETTSDLTSLNPETATKTACALCTTLFGSRPLGRRAREGAATEIAVFRLV
ncbi:hypothetical protein HRbin10_00195 [bacterium HR10]|nr:hypothetical protein HRbin10_00195 [bacterium HR10]